MDLIGKIGEVFTGAGPAYLVVKYVPALADKAATWADFGDVLTPTGNYAENAARFTAKALVYGLGLVSSVSAGKLIGKGAKVGWNYLRGRGTPESA